MSPPSRSFRLYCFGLGAAAVLIAAGIAFWSPLPPLGAVLLLSTMFAFAENASVELPNQSSLSASLMLAMAAIVLFESESPLLGPMLVSAAGCLYVPQFQKREWAKISFNLANFGLSALAAAAVYAALPLGSHPSVGLQLLGSVPVALTYASCNSILLMPAVAMMTRRPLRDVSREMWTSDVQILPFALLGVLLGRLYLDLGAWVVPLFVAPILIARQAFASYLALRSAQQGILETLIHALEAKDHYTAGHAERVARYARLIGVELGFKTRRLERLHQAALMHDVGKLVVPNHLLKKPGKLTPEEFDHVRLHEPVSLELIRRIDFLLPIAPTIEAEFKDAADGAHTAPIEGRIIAVCDAYDAMTSTRAYRRALSQEVAFAELRDKAGGQFDAECVETLIHVLEDLGEQHGAGHEADVTEFEVPPPSAGIGSAGLGDLESDDREVPTQ